MTNGTVYINNLILCDAARLKTLTDETGFVLLTSHELNALDGFFPGVGVRWTDGAIVGIPPCRFRLVVKSDDVDVLCLHDCSFLPPDGVPRPDDEYTQVYFTGRRCVLGEACVKKRGDS